MTKADKELIPAINQSLGINLEYENNLDDIRQKLSAHINHLINQINLILQRGKWNVKGNFPTFLYIKFISKMLRTLWEHFCIRRAASEC